MKWLDKIPLTTLIIITLLLGLAPFTPEPHLWQKLKMLAAGELVKPIDIFDLFLHGDTCSSASYQTHAHAEIDFLRQVFVKY